MGGYLLVEGVGVAAWVVVVAVVVIVVVEVVVDDI
jgi:hypothetical protein